MTLFSDIGAALYGAGRIGARVKLAAALQIDYRTIERFSSGSMVPAAGVWLALAELLETQGPDRISSLRIQAKQRATLASRQASESFSGEVDHMNINKKPAR